MEQGRHQLNEGAVHKVIRRLRAVGAVRVLLCTVAAIAFGATQGAGAAQAAGAATPPPGLPGPPPGAGSGLPLPPPPGQSPGTEANGPPATIPAGPSGPGLVSGTASLRGTRVTLSIACQAGGRVILSSPSLASGILAQAHYRCSRRRATARLSLRTNLAQRIARMGQALATVQLVQGKTTERLSVVLAARPATASYWTSNFGLRCQRPGYQAQLLAPNFSDTLPTTIDVRPWLAWYTNANGWQWLGTAGPNASRWYRWTATPSGVAEWRTAAGGLTPWTWSPINVTPGHGIYVIAVFEAVYWYSHPQYVWSYARSGEGNGAIATYCAYP
jgi:hypothetical protein